jgi:ribosomal protein S1
LDEIGVEGLIHVSEIPQAEGVLLKEVLREGNPFRCVCCISTQRITASAFSMRLD